MNKIIGTIRLDCRSLGHSRAASRKPLRRASRSASRISPDSPHPMLHPKHDTSVSLQYGEEVYLIDMLHDVPSVGFHTVVYTEWALLPKQKPLDKVVPHLAACIGKMLDANYDNIPKENQNGYSKQLHLSCALADKKRRRIVCDSIAR